MGGTGVSVDVGAGVGVFDGAMVAVAVLVAGKVGVVSGGGVMDGAVVAMLGLAEPQAVITNRLAKEVMIRVIFQYSLFNIGEHLEIIGLCVGHSVETRVIVSQTVGGIVAPGYWFAWRLCQSSLNKLK